MTNLIPGKRYRVSFVGIADEHGGIGLAGSTRFTGMDIDHAATVELLPEPLPTTPGSVVRWKQWSGELRTLSRETGRLPWRDVNSPHLCFSDEEVQGATVLFDVGP